tara:strand:+ start:346 stop:639 length:294 start_codon:yes stop_codon:yes gene_type:complete
MDEDTARANAAAIEEEWHRRALRAPLGIYIHIAATAYSDHPAGWFVVVMVDGVRHLDLRHETSPTNLLDWLEVEEDIAMHQQREMANQAAQVEAAHA